MEKKKKYICKDCKEEFDGLEEVKLHVREFSHYNYLDLESGLTICFL